jgi:competence protein ComEA
MKQVLREYFSFNKRERNGIFVLLLLIFSLFSYLLLAEHLVKTEQVDFSPFQQEIALLDEALYNNAVADSAKFATPYQQKNIPKTDIHYFPFNPNNLSVDNWKTLGLTENQIHVIHNYEAKGGRFYKKEDVQKMYCINERQYQALAPFINIPKATQTSPQAKPTPTLVVIEKQTIDINTATEEQLLSINGIGDYYAKEIIKLRLLLGGFYAKNQLLALWKFDNDKLTSIEKQISIDKSVINTININTCTAKQLKHPYLTWNQVNAIINYRTAHGAYQSVDDIKNTGVINEDVYAQISPYLIVQ